MRTPALWLLLPGFALGQFAGLSTSHDGRVLHFSTMLRQNGTQQLNYGKIFRVTPEKGVELALERDYVPIPGVSSTSPYTPGLDYSLSSFYRLGHTFTSESGALAGFSEEANCRGPSAIRCSIMANRTTLGMRSVPGTGVITPDGQYALTLTLGPLGRSIVRYYRGGVVAREFVTPFSATPGFPAFQIADDGSFSYQGPHSTFLITAQGREAEMLGLTQVRFLGRTAYLLDENGDLDVLDLASGMRRRIRSNMGTCLMRIGLSGTIYQACDGLGRVSLRGGSFETLTKDQIVDFIVSSNEAVAWYLSAAGEIRSIDLASGVTRRYVGPTPTLLEALPAISAHNLTKLPAVTLAPTTAATPPLPYELAGVRVLVNGEPAPIAAVGPDGVVFQAPHAPAGFVPLRVEVAGASEFTKPFSTTASVLLHDPRFVRDSRGQMALAVHGDWNGLVTNVRPAQGGEVLHFYLTGWSGVPGAPPLGHPAPQDRAIPSDGSIACSLNQSNERPGSVEVLFLGLAPGTVGYSQLSVRLPARVAPGVAQLTCRLEKAAWSGGDSVVFPVQ